jgi:NitT/TauT family transport system substrate-binding protein
MLRKIFVAASLGLMVVAGDASAADKVVLQLGWFAEPEFGGFLQAQKTGIYERHGLDVDIRMGGPQTNAPQSLFSGQADFTAGSSADVLNARAQDLPGVVVAAIFQRDPHVLISHKGAGNDTLEGMKGKPMMIAGIDQVTFWPFLRAKYAYTDEQIRPYTFNFAPFLADKGMIQQGYLTSEPFALKKAGADINVFLLSQHGYESIGSALMTTEATIAKRPDVVQRFVDASIEGWRDYLHGDPKLANQEIKTQNADMNDDQIAYTMQALKDSGMVESGDALKGGIGAMTDARWKALFDQVSSLGLYPASLDYKKAYTLRFVAGKSSQ